MEVGGGSKIGYRIIAKGWEWWSKWNEIVSTKSIHIITYIKDGLGGEVSPSRNLLDASFGVCLGRLSGPAHRNSNNNIIWCKQAILRNNENRESKNKNDRAHTYCYCGKLDPRAKFSDGKMK